MSKGNSDSKSSVLFLYSLRKSNGRRFKLSVNIYIFICFEFYLYAEAWFLCDDLIIDASPVGVIVSVGGCILNLWDLAAYRLDWDTADCDGL